eukprot:1159823-Pelagomonas_calceolata.AAC.3
MTRDWHFEAPLGAMNSTVRLRWHMHTATLCPHANHQVANLPKDPTAPLHNCTKLVLDHHPALPCTRHPSAAPAVFQLYHSLGFHPHTSPAVSILKRLRDLVHSLKSSPARYCTQKGTTFERLPLVAGLLVALCPTFVKTGADLVQELCYVQHLAQSVKEVVTRKH